MIKIKSIKFGFNTAEIAENKAIKYLCGDDLSLERDYRINQIIN